MQNKKYLSMLGMARRAGKLSMGHDMAEKAIKTKKAKMLIFACDISPRLKSEFSKTLEKYQSDICVASIEENISQLHNALGYKAGVLTVDDENFAKRIKELINA